MLQNGTSVNMKKSKLILVLPTVLEDPFQWAILDLELCEVNEIEVELSLAATGELEREVIHALLGPRKDKTK